MNFAISQVNFKQYIGLTLCIILKTVSLAQITRTLYGNPLPPLYRAHHSLKKGDFGVLEPFLD